MPRKRNNCVSLKHKKLLRYFHSFVERFGRAPTYQELADGLHLASRSNAYRTVTELVELGLIKRTPSKSRALHIIPKTLPF